MDTASHSNKNDSPRVYLVLELTFQGHRRRFAMAPDDDRAVSVGSAHAVDLRILEPGIAPVHFHFERDGSVLWVTPTACSRRLRMNAVRLLGRAAVPQDASLEFAGQILEVSWHCESFVSQHRRTSSHSWRANDARPAVVDARARERAIVSYVEALPGDGDLTWAGPKAAGDASTTSAFPAASSARWAAAPGLQERGCSPMLRTLHARQQAAAAIRLAPSVPPAPAWLRTERLFPVEPDAVSGTPARFRTKGRCARQPFVEPSRAGSIPVAPPMAWRTWPQRLEASCRRSAKSRPQSTHVRVALRRFSSGAQRRATGKAWHQLLVLAAKLGALTQRKPRRVLSIALALALTVAALAARYDGSRARNNFNQRTIGAVANAQWR